MNALPSIFLHKGQINFIAALGLLHLYRSYRLGICGLRQVRVVALGKRIGNIAGIPSLYALLAQMQVPVRSAGQEGEDLGDTLACEGEE